MYCKMFKRISPMNNKSIYESTQHPYEFTINTKTLWKLAHNKIELDCNGRTTYKFTMQEVRTESIFWHTSNACELNHNDCLYYEDCPNGDKNYFDYYVLGK